jgi:RNA polymerase sigma-70 factor (ECF subfamily)
MDLGVDNLLSRAVQGDQDALVTLLNRHGPAVRPDLIGRIPRHHQAVLSEDDIMQQTYADAATHIREFVGDSEVPFLAWLKTIARRNLRDALKALDTEKRGGNHHQAVARTWDESAVALCELLRSPGTSPTAGTARNDRIAALRRAILQLPEAYARVIQLYDLENRSVEEVAAAVQRSTGAVFMLRARAHERLHEMMGRTSNFFGDSA